MTQLYKQASNQVTEHAVKLKEQRSVIDDLRRNYRSERAIVAQLHLLGAIERSQAAISSLLERFSPHIEHLSTCKKEKT
ncbi:hypothetical protein NQ117_21005 [Paenibacillus sp. SC116]|uniref:hypothetical protein n=1 Tax=Paenibacillus sp. SC116 TaxID=2968986 RepID=UPI00215A7EA9|nr:hypothetical protein [Paenibacillus sp. SC116]MCR8846166.1 hypothetical protein [Paenibacillus sp. SC116]